MGFGILYAIIILIVISVAAIAGIRGGVVLRPVFDAIGYHDPMEIAFYMGVAVITMSISSTIKQMAMGTKINYKKVFALAIGSLIGGFFGQMILSIMDMRMTANMIQSIQSIFSIISLVFVMMFTKPNIKTYDFRGTIWYVITGLGLGTFATILAIGGGPINVIVFVILFGITLKESTVYSITTIFFAQAARLSTMVGRYGIARFDLNLLWFVIPAAIVWGIIGGRLNVKCSETQVLKVFKFVVVGTIILNIYNVIDFWWLNI